MMLSAGGSSALLLRLRMVVRPMVYMSFWAHSPFSSHIQPGKRSHVSPSFPSQPQGDENARRCTARLAAPRSRAAQPKVELRSRTLLPTPARPRRAEATAARSMKVNMWR